MKNLFFWVVLLYNIIGDRMKKILIILFSVFMITGCGDKLRTYTEITFAEYANMIENKETFILLIGQPNCSHCADFKPTIEKIIKKYQIEVKYIDISKLSDKEYSILKNKTFVSGTPNTVFIKDGKLDTRAKIGGAKSYNAVVNALKKVGYINE